MWDSYDSRLRAKAQARKEAEKKARRSLRLPGVMATVKPAGGNEETVQDAFIALCDLSPAGVTFFSEHPMHVGTDVALTLEQPKQFYVKGRLVACKEYNVNSKVISANPLSFRITMRFVFDSEEERDEVEKYCHYICTEVLRDPEAA